MVDIIKQLKQLSEIYKNSKDPDILRKKGHREIKSFESFHHNFYQKDILKEVKKVRDKYKGGNTITGFTMNKSQNIDDIVFIDNYDPWMFTKGTYRAITMGSERLNMKNPDANVYNKVLIEFFFWDDGIINDNSHDQMEWRSGFSWWGYPRDIVILERDFSKYGKIEIKDKKYDGYDLMLWLNAELLDKIKSYYLFRICDPFEFDYKRDLKNRGINVIRHLDGRYFLIEEDVFHSLLQAYLINYPEHRRIVEKTNHINKQSLFNFNFDNSHRQKFGDDIEFRLFNYNLKRFQMSDSSDLADSSSEFY